MIYVWRWSQGTWAIRPARLGNDWALVWYDSAETPALAIHYADARQAVDAVVQKKTGVPVWDTAIGMANNIQTLESWEQVDQFP